MTTRNHSRQQGNLMSSITISNQTRDSLKIALSKSPETDAYVWMIIDLLSGRTDSIIVTPPRYGFHISYKAPNNPGREIRSNSIRFNQAKLGIAVRQEPDNKIMVQATEQDLPDQMIRVVNEAGLQVTAYVTQNDKNVVSPALLDSKAVFEAKLGDDTYYATILDHEKTDKVAVTPGQIVIVKESITNHYQIIVTNERPRD